MKTEKFMVTVERRGVFLGIMIQSEEIGNLTKTKSNNAMPCQHSNSTPQWHTTRTCQETIRVHYHALDRCPLKIQTVQQRPRWIELTSAFENRVLFFSH